MTLVVTVNYQGEVFSYELPLPEWWYMPASSEYLHHMAMGILYEHDWREDDKGFFSYSWWVKS